MSMTWRCLNKYFTNINVKFLESFFSEYYRKVWKITGQSLKTNYKVHILACFRRQCWLLDGDSARQGTVGWPRGGHRAPGDHPDHGGRHQWQARWVFLSQSDQSPLTVIMWWDRVDQVTWDNFHFHLITVMGHWDLSDAGQCRCVMVTNSHWRGGWNIFLSRWITIYF